MGLFVGDTAPSKVFVGGQQVSKIFVGATQVRPTTPPGPQPRTPGANTLVYYPFTDDYADHSGNGYNVANTNSTRLVTLALTGVKCLHLNGSYCTTDVTGTPLLVQTLPYTIVFWTLGNNRYWSQTFAINWYEAGSWGGSGITAPTSVEGQIECRAGNPTDQIKKWTSTQMGAYNDSDSWHCFVVSYTTSGLRVYFDGVHVSAADTNWTTGPVNNGSPLKIGQRQDNTVCGQGWISSVIIENKAWTAQDAADFYDTTKSYYGIS